MRRVPSLACKGQDFIFVLARHIRAFSSSCTYACFFFDMIICTKGPTASGFIGRTCTKTTIVSFNGHTNVIRWNGRLTIRSVFFVAFPTICMFVIWNDLWKDFWDNIYNTFFYWKLCIISKWGIFLNHEIFRTLLKVFRNSKKHIYQ